MKILIKTFLLYVYLTYSSYSFEGIKLDCSWEKTLFDKDSYTSEKHFDGFDDYTYYNNNDVLYDDFAIQITEDGCAFIGPSGVYPITMKVYISEDSFQCGREDLTSDAEFGEGVKRTKILNRKTISINRYTGIAFEETYRLVEGIKKRSMKFPQNENETLVYINHEPVKYSYEKIIQGELRCKQLHKKF